MTSESIMGAHSMFQIDLVADLAQDRYKRMIRNETLSSWGTNELRLVLASVSLAASVFINVLVKLCDGRAGTVDSDRVAEMAVIQD